MTIATFPIIRGGLGPAGGMSWRKLSNTQAFESPLTRSVQTFSMPGARWACTATWQNLTADEASLFRAFLYGLRGRAGRFYLPHFGRRAPLSAMVTIVSFIPLARPAAAAPSVEAISAAAGGADIA